MQQKKLEFKDKVKILVDEFGKGNNSELARILGVNEAKVRAYLNGTLPKLDAIQCFLDKLPINSEWLFYDNVEMLRESDIEIEDTNEITIESIISDRVKEAIEPMIKQYKIMSLQLAQFQLDKIKEDEGIKSKHL